MRSSTKRGFTLIELLVVIAIIAILASILFPVFAKARAQARKATCISQVRQQATAIQMYAQDNGGQMPGTAWVNNIASYLGNSDKMFQCPEDNTKDSGAVSYGYAGVLVRKDGTGVKEAGILSPSEVGVVCDATPSSDYPTGKLIGGGALLAEATVAALPSSRHAKGTVAGYADGHAKYTPGTFNEKDMANGITRAFYQVASLGLVENALGCVGAGATVGAATGTVTVGGEYAAQPLIMAAAQLYGNFYSRGFLGGNYVTGKPASAWLWGNATTGDYSGQMGRIAVCVIVAKGSKIPNLPSMTNSSYAVSTATTATWFGQAYTANSIQAYYMPTAYSQVAAAAASLLGCNGVGEAVQVANDAEMVDKVANDPYAIGYCASPFADPDRVTVLSLVSGGTTYTYPQASAKYRWVMPAAGPSWPVKMDLYPSSSAGDVGATLAATLVPGAGLLTQLQQGPLFKAGYWP